MCSIHYNLVEQYKTTFNRTLRLSKFYNYSCQLKFHFDAKNMNKSRIIISSNRLIIDEYKKPKNSSTTNMLGNR